MSQFGRLTQIKQLREHWEDEADDFTPWLAEEENITLLGESIGINLEVEAQERNVGPFRADILCRDTDTDNWVLIENQLEPTDHKHLGQLLTYAAGLDAVTTIWIAENFTDEHRAALDWLNRITDEAFSFFGLEIELWQIGNSAVAPKFNVVSHPNDWQRTIRRSVQKRLTSTNELYLDYWTEVMDLLEKRNGSINPVKSKPQGWQNFAIGRTGFHLTAIVRAQNERVGVRLMLNHQDADIYFSLLEEDKDDIEKEMNTELEWRENPGKKEKHVELFLNDIDPQDRESWNDQHQWICDKLELFHRVFSPRVKTLDANDVDLPQFVA